MTLYDLIRGVSEILTPETNSLFEYIINSSDDNGGFLRTCWCKKSSPLKDFELRNRKKIVVCFRNPFSEGDKYFNDGDFSRNETLVKLQLFYGFSNTDDDMVWSAHLCYPHAYVIDLENKTAEYINNEGII